MRRVTARIDPTYLVAEEIRRPLWNVKYLIRTFERNSIGRVQWLKKASVLLELVIVAKRRMTIGHRKPLKKRKKKEKKKKRRKRKKKKKKKKEGKKKKKKKRRKKEEKKKREGRGSRVKFSIRFFRDWWKWTSVPNKLFS